MASRNPDFAALSEAAYEAADSLIEHLDDCGACLEIGRCEIGDPLRLTYRTKKDKALQAIRGKKK